MAGACLLQLIDFDGQRHVSLSPVRASPPSEKQRSCSVGQRKVPDATGKGLENLPQLIPPFSRWQRFCRPPAEECHSARLP